MKNRELTHKNIIILGIILIILVTVFSPKLKDLTGKQTFDTTANNPNLVAYYSFDENTNDLSGNDNHGIQHGGVDCSVDGISSKACSFDGVDDCIEVPDSLSLDNIQEEITISIWIKEAEEKDIYVHLLPGYYFFIGKRHPTLEQTYSLGKFSTSLALFYKQTAKGGDAVRSSEIFPINQWVHLVGTYNGTNLKIYENSEEKGSKEARALGTLKTSDDPLLIGGFWPEGHMFNGTIDEVRIYNKALSQQEINELYNKNVQVTCIDSDGGKNYYVQGEVTIVKTPGYLYKYTESCFNQTHLTEHYCKEDNTLGHVPFYYCPNGCQGGACILKTTCIEGERVDGQYCDSNGDLQLFKSQNDVCAYDYECIDNICENNKCLLFSGLQQAYCYLKEQLGQTSDSDYVALC